MTKFADLKFECDYSCLFYITLVKSCQNLCFQDALRCIKEYLSVYLVLASILIVTDSLSNLYSILRILFYCKFSNICIIIPYLIIITQSINPSPAQKNCRLLYYMSASIIKVLQCRSKFVKMLSECQTAWLQVRRRVTRRLIQIQAVCIWHYSRAWRSKG